MRLMCSGGCTHLAPLLPAIHSNLRLIYPSHIYLYYLPRVGWGFSLQSSMLSSIPTFQVTTATSGLTVHNAMDSRPKTALPITSTGSTHQASYPQGIPPIVVKKILSLEYVEMAELLPEYWGAEEPESPCCSNQQSKTARRGPVTDCYASLVSVLCSAHPHKFPHFMAYQRTIIRAHRMFIGDRWVIYDACYQ